MSLPRNLEKLSCFRTDGGHDGLEEQTKTILDEPLEFGKTFINSASVNAAIEGGDTVETGNSTGTADTASG